MSNLIVLLIAVATAFPTGWLLCRAWLNATGQPAGDRISKQKHHEMLQAQRSRYRGQVQRVMKLVKKHEAARDHLREKLDAVDVQTDSKQRQTQRLEARLKESREATAAAKAELAQTQAQADKLREQLKKLEHELGLLQIERDELSAQAERRDAEAKAAAIPEISAAEKAASRAERGELRENLASAEHRQRELETRLRDRDMQIEELQQTVESWKHRVAPLARQIQSYRDAIKKLQLNEQAAQTQPMTRDKDAPKDPLQRIRGIGPALERRLNSHGIRTFAQLAALDDVEIAALADKLAIAPSLPTRDEWTRQAQELSTSDDLTPAA